MRLCHFLLVACLGTSSLQLDAQITPLIHGHAHNDYEHKRPLFDALDDGFCSVEADIYLVDGKLLVAHDRDQVKPERTLQALYLDPLRERVKKNGGHVFPDGPECTLLIDMKSDWRRIYPALRAVLTNYADVLTCFRDGKKQTNAITVIISGNRSLRMFAGENVRYAAFDGDLANLDSSESANLIPWISGQWSKTFKWNGAGPMPDGERQRLKEIVVKTHERGRKIRFWGAPDTAAFWQAMLDNGVDLINTDDLDGLKKFFQAGGH